MVTLDRGYDLGAAERAPWLLLFAFAPASWLRNARLMVAAVVVAVVALPAGQVANKVLFQPQAQYATQSLFLFDLARRFRMSSEDNAGNVWNAGTLEWLPTGD